MKLILGTEKGSPAFKAGIKPGDKLITVNGKKIKDVFDYRFFIQEKKLLLEIEHENGTLEEYKITKDEYEDLGLEFETGLMDKSTHCANKCIFCFIDQLPKNCRSTLYFKDDDVRLSFLSGNYVTLTNITDEELDRLISYRLSPINISVHTTDPKLRSFMLNNPRAAKITDMIQKLHDSNISMNFQIVLCKNVNDKEHLEESIHRLADYIPKAQSLSVVPVGLTKHRQALYSLEPFTKEDSQEVLDLIHKRQEKFLKEKGTRFIYAADEFYLKAEREFPPVDEYEDFPQIENGVGMISLMKDEFLAALRSQKTCQDRKISIATGQAAYEFIKNLTQKATDKFPQLTVDVHKVENNFFGPLVSVAGLICGNDIYETLKDKDLGKYLLIPLNSLRNGEDVFLDDLRLSELESKLNIKIIPVCNDGYDFLDAIVNPQI